MASNSHGALSPQRERNSNLKKYYSVPQEPLDGGAVNKAKYFEDLLKASSLRELVKKDNDLMSEIREIDGDMKTLVYENYNKFISATDTIRKMKFSVESMESETKNLTENISNISQHCDAINEALGGSREELYRLSCMNHSLRHLQFIRQLPEHLNQFLFDQQYAKAVNYYSAASTILAQYQQLPACKAIEQECNTIMADINAKLSEENKNETD